MEKGLSFEHLVCDMYRRLGKKNLEHDVSLKSKDARSQFDMRYGMLRKKYVECKYRTSSSVTFAEVATFKAKLELYAISPKRGIFITNADYEKRAKVYAKKVGLKLIDGYELKKLYRKSLPLLKRFRSLDSIHF